MWATLGAVVALSAQPSDQTVIYYNARMALRENQPTEAVKLWLLRNSVENQSNRVSSHDADFRSVTWAALGALGVCQDGQPTDEDGVGLWPIALHNWLVRNMGRRVSKAAAPFEAFDVGRQSRRISINDIVSAEEFRTVQFAPRRCLRPRLLLATMGESPFADLSDPGVVTHLQLYLVNRARDTLVRDQVNGMAAIEARRFDLHLKLMALAAREAVIKARKDARLGREIGLTRTAIGVMREDAPTHLFETNSIPAAILRTSATWPASEWMALSPDRRLFLFDHARAFGVDPVALDGVVLGVIDALVETGDGTQVESWIARLSPSASIASVWADDRGARLLALDAQSGFRERGVVALHRGLHLLEQGDLRGSLRSLAFALQQAPSSRAAEETQRISRRWLAYVAAQFESTAELLATLQELVPSRDYAWILEDLMWRSTLRADWTSFDRAMNSRAARSGGRAALDRRFALCLPLAKGDLGGFARLIRTGLTEAPSETLRFLDLLVAQIELEDADVRVAHRATLGRTAALILPLTFPPSEGMPSRQSRTATTLLERIEAIEEGVGGVGADASAQDRARALAPTGEVFAGSVRLAPADALPWPFAATAVAAPSVFTPLDLTPREWRDASGDWVFGWSIDG